VGGNFDTIGGVDNFCWPDIQFDHKKNPDGKFKAAQLVRACRALKETCLAYEIPLLSGKDSMYVDGYLHGKYNESVKVSALETMQFSAVSVIDDIKKCITCDAKMPGDFICIIGTTLNELGASEYYELMGKTGLNIPEVKYNVLKNLYKALETAVKREIIASAKAVARGGIAVHLAMTVMAGGLGLECDLGKIPFDDEKGEKRDDILLFSESPGRFIVTIAPENKDSFEELFKNLPFSFVGKITDQNTNFVIKGIDGATKIDLPVFELEKVWEQSFS
jgi:phosphoribosylformylglycinamidine synthase